MRVGTGWSSTIGTTEEVVEEGVFDRMGGCAYGSGSDGMWWWRCEVMAD